MAETLISFDLRADFGFFKKPDVNDGLVMTYNLLHRPALLGLLGAIAGLSGYEKKNQKPEYLEVLGALRVGIAPLNVEGETIRHDKGNFQKTVIKYSNTVGYANANESGKSGANLLITEQTLIRPAYRCFVLLDLANETQAVLYERIKRGEAYFLPYLGKNECLASWDNVMEWDSFRPFNPREREFKIESAFVRKYSVRSTRVGPQLVPAKLAVINVSSFIYFERLPTGFDEDLFQYELSEFAFADWVLGQESSIENLYEIQTGAEKQVIQLF